MPEENMKSLIKTFDILELFLQGKDELSVTEISKTLGLNKTTVSRILSKLAKRGYLRQVEKHGKFCLGTIFLEFSGIVKRQLKLREIAMPYLFELNRLVKESVIIGVWDRRGPLVTETIHEANYSNSPLKIVPDEGISIPLNCTCSGKIILADMSEDEFFKYFNENKIEPRTPNTITNIQKIKDQLLNVARDGVAFDDEEYAIGVRGIASGIRDNEGKIVGSVGVVAPSVRLSLNGMMDLVPVIKKYADEISKQLGYLVR
jgi:IclR family transcriptional regulator, KDG regulon repressor